MKLVFIPLCFILAGCVDPTTFIATKLALNTVGAVSNTVGSTYQPEYIAPSAPEPFGISSVKNSPQEKYASIEPMSESKMAIYEDCMYQKIVQEKNIKCK